MATIDLYIGAKKILVDPTSEARCGALGAGVYLCDKASTARELACRGGSDGYISRYELELRGLKVLDLCERKHGILPWLALLLENRSLDASASAKALAKKIIAQNRIDTAGYDVIIGFRHDGSAFSAIRAYLEGEISAEILEAAIGGRGCPKQLVLATEKARAALKFIAYAYVKTSMYYPRSIYRDSELRKACFGADATYINELGKNLSEAIDHAVGALSIAPARFIEMLCVSGVMDRLDAREPAYAVGMSGIELANETLERVGIKKAPAQTPAHVAEYALGEYLVKYSADRGICMKSILGTIKSELLCSFDRSDLSTFSAELDKALAAASASARLQEQRKLRGLSQRELADAAGVNLRTLQQYELKTKDINKAAATAVLSLARVLGCAPEDILEL